MPNRALDKHDKRGLKSSELFPPSLPSATHYHGGNNRGDLQTEGESSSSAIVSPIVKNGVNENNKQII